MPTLMITLLAVVALYFDPYPLQELRLQIFDLEQSIFPRQSLGENSPVRIVRIDDKSLARKGQWPWPRTLVAELVDKIAAAHPAVLGIDILFAEPDRMSPPTLARALPGLPHWLSEGLAELPSSDDRLADALRASNLQTVPGFALTKKALCSESERALCALSHYAEKLESLSILTNAAKAQGSITVEPDIDGVSRRLPLAAVYRGNLVPGFAAAVLSVAASGSAPPPRLTLGPNGIESVVTGIVSVPTDRAGTAWLHFSPGSLSYSAADILDGALDPGLLKDKLVLLAVTGLGTVDLQRTPLGPIYGIDFHAQLIDSILTDQLLVRPAEAPWVEVSAVLLASLTMAWLVPYGSPFWAGIAAVSMVLLLVGGELALFCFAGWLVDGVFPSIATLVFFGAMLQGSLGAAQVERRLLEAELQREQGELGAARDVQLGLLPHRFPDFLDRRDVEVYARIEPARETGGDLFDFLLIGRDRLFFFIGDVSGKGVPAALIMMMTKEVVREASARPSAALDGVLAEANTRIAAASAELAGQGRDMMFVTAFAGVLDLASGAVVYASAGHDAPFVIRRDRQPRQLATEGGPPLGAVEDFAFPLDRGRLEPGEILLLYTDGVTEAQDETGALYSAERLSALLASVPAETAEGAVSLVFDDVRRFAARAEQADDITLLAIRRIAAP